MSKTWIILGLITSTTSLRALQLDADCNIEYLLYRLANEPTVPGITRLEIHSYETIPISDLGSVILRLRKSLESLQIARGSDFHESYRDDLLDILAKERLLDRVSVELIVIEGLRDR